MIIIEKDYPVAMTKRQLDFMLEPLERINLLEGSVRSGKTWVSLVAWDLFIRSMPAGSEFLMSGKTLSTLRRNCLSLLQEIDPSVSFSIQSKSGWIGGRRVWLEGADNKFADNKIRGMTLAGVYIDELTLIPEEFYLMALSRMSVHGARLFATTNPDSPMSYVYTKIINNNKIRKKVSKFLITENTFLDDEYINALAAEYQSSGTVFYQRFFLGEWVIAEGLVYPMYKNTVPTVYRTYEKFIVSMDYGIQNPTAMLLFGMCDGQWYLVDEYYHSGRETNQQKTDDEYYQELEYLCGDRKISKVIVDPSAASFIALIRRNGTYPVVKAKNDVYNGIRRVASVLANKQILVNDVCENTIKEFGLYSWDKNSAEDRVIKENDHCLTGDTLVHTEHDAIPICELVGKSGNVWSYNIHTGKPELKPFTDCRMTQLVARLYIIKTVDGRTIKCTHEHPILTERGYVEARNIKTTDSIVDILLGLVRVAEVRVGGLGAVYNMEVADNHNFAVNDGLIVHNCMDAFRYFVNTEKIYRKIDSEKENTYKSIFG